MPFSFQETPESRAQESGTSSSATHKLVYKAVGEQDDYTVHAYAIANTPLYVTRPTGILLRNSISITPDGFNQYTVEASYGRPDKNAIPANSYTFNFDTTGGTVNVKCAKQHINTYPSGGPNHNGMIGVEKDGKVNGADIIIPKLRFTLTFKFASGIITIAYMKALADVTGTVNSVNFLGFAPGELLFMGATGSNGTQTEMEVSFSFEASPNVTGLSRGTVTGIAKKGHEYIWEQPDDDVDGDDNAVQTVTAVHVERVYDTADWNPTFKWNIFTG